jgi:hypothetical protein
MQRCRIDADPSLYYSGCPSAAVVRYRVTARVVGEATLGKSLLGILEQCE